VDPRADLDVVGSQILRSLLCNFLQYFFATHLGSMYVCIYNDKGKVSPVLQLSTTP
jgi:hypothetical protein